MKHHRIFSCPFQRQIRTDDHRQESILLLVVPRIASETINRIPSPSKMFSADRAAPVPGREYDVYREKTYDRIEEFIWNQFGLLGQFKSLQQEEDKEHDTHAPAEYVLSASPLPIFRPSIFCRDIRRIHTVSLIYTD